MDLRGRGPVARRNGGTHLPPPEGAANHSGRSASPLKGSRARILRKGTLAVVIRPAVPTDIQPLSNVLARAFRDDPGFAWMLPRRETRAPRLRGVFATMLRAEALRYGGVEVALAEGRLVGGAIWFPPNHWQPTRSEQVRSRPGYAQALGRQLSRATSFVQSLARVHPSEPHWYLVSIGVEPEFQGRGVAGSLLRSRLDRCDRSGESAYLEASNPAGIPIYRRFGFQPTAIPKLPDGAPAITPMWRSPTPRRAPSNPGI